MKSTKKKKDKWIKPVRIDDCEEMTIEQLFKEWKKRFPIGVDVAMSDFTRFQMQRPLPQTEVA